jgi:hypothetical protein
MSIAIAIFPQLENWAGQSDKDDKNTVWQAPESGLETA